VASRCSADLVCHLSCGNVNYNSSVFSFFCSAYILLLEDMEITGVTYTSNNYLRRESLILPFTFPFIVRPDITYTMWNGRLCWHTCRFGWTLSYWDQSIYLYLPLGHYPRSREDSGNYAIRNCKPRHCTLRFILSSITHRHGWPVAPSVMS